MNTQLTARPTEQVVAAIQALDLDPIKFKLMDPEEGQGWSREYVDQMAIEYKRFLTLSVKYPEETIAPSKDVDKFWHGHILDTMKYAEDCQNVFGYFLHHFPYFGMRGEEDAANLAEAGNTTNRLYEKEFGGTQRTVCTRRNLGKESPAERLIAPSRSRLTARLQLLPRRPPTAPSQSRLTARLRLLPRRPLTAPSRSRLTARLQLLQRRPLTAPSQSRLTARLRLLPRKPLTAPSQSRLTARLRLLPRKPPTAPSRSRPTARLQLLPRRLLTAPLRLKSQPTAQWPLPEKRLPIVPSRPMMGALEESKGTSSTRRCVPGWRSPPDLALY